MQKLISLVVMLLLLMQLVPAAFGEDSVANRITELPEGARIELRLKNHQKLKGARGPVSNLAFTLTDPVSGDRQIAFDDVASIKQVSTRSHVRRNVLIGVGIGVAALGITIGIMLRCGPLGCPSRIAI